MTNPNDDKGALDRVRLFSADLGIISPTMALRTYPHALPQHRIEALAYDLRTLLRLAEAALRAHSHPELIEAAYAYRAALKDEFMEEGLIGIEKSQTALCEAAENLPDREV